ncbi:MAG: transposase [Acidobacteria bacterium]|nr:transposase [Acidobacteriota bacterium]
MWVADADLPRTAGHPFYERLNRLLDESGFDAFVEEQCAKFYAEGVGRPSLPPGRYFRMLLLGYFEGLESERAMAWRAADSPSVRQFLDLALQEAPADHSTVSGTRRRIDVETHEAVSTWVMQRVADAGLLKGKTVGIDATTLEGNAALPSIVRRDWTHPKDPDAMGPGPAADVGTRRRRHQRGRPRRAPAHVRAPRIVPVESGRRTPRVPPASGREPDPRPVATVATHGPQHPGGRLDHRQQPVEVQPVPRRRGLEGVPGRSGAADEPRALADRGPRGDGLRLPPTRPHGKCH